MCVCVHVPAAPMDYQDVNLTITFSPGVTLRTVRVNTTDDDVYEDTEVFIVLLSNPTELLRVVNGIASVEIMDNDSEYTIQKYVYWHRNRSAPGILKKKSV